MTLSAASDAPVTVDYATADGSATAGGDYQAASGTVIFAPGQTSQTITVLVNGDRAAEPTEYFFVNLAGPANAGLADGQGVGTIADDEPHISVGGEAIAEGNVGTTELTFTVTLSAACNVPVTVDYATGDGSALAGEDYTAASGTLTFAPGELFQTVTVPVNGDLDIEYDESVFVTLSNPTGAVIDVDQAWGTILGDDGILVSVGDSSGQEPYYYDGWTNVFSFDVRLSAPSAETVTVDFSTIDGSATGYYDYLPAWGTLTFAPGETSQTIGVEVLADTEDEWYETFYVYLNVSSGNALIEEGLGTGTISEWWW